jgi:uncharacterized SAM-binding protein YcdF (DUF218 family)
VDAVTSSLTIALAFFLVCDGSFAAVLYHDKRTLWTGALAVLTVISLGVLLLVGAMIIFNVTGADHKVLLGILVAIALLILIATLLFMVTVVVMFLAEGVRILTKEGWQVRNMLSLATGILLVGYLVVWPFIGRLARQSFTTYLYEYVSLVALYLLFLVSMYALTAILNLYNPGKHQLDYLVVLGAGLIGERVSPVLAARIDRAIGLLAQHPHARLVMSGGQGPDEVIPEAVAMKNYAVAHGVPAERIILEDQSRTTYENIKFSYRLIKPGAQVALVTNSFHVYRALLIAKRQGFKCIGYGAKTRWYFTLNAFVREFAAYLKITYRMQLTVAVGIAALVIFDALAQRF